MSTQNSPKRNSATTPVSNDVLPNNDLISDLDQKTVQVPIVSISSPGAKLSKKYTKDPLRTRPDQPGPDQTELSDDDGPLLHPGSKYFQSKCGTPYNPDTESGDSLYSDSTELFR